MQIESIPDSNTNFSLVFLKDTGKYIKNLTPHCKKHGSMNKVSVFEKEGLLPYLNKITVGTLFLENATSRSGNLDFIQKLHGRFNIALGLVNQKKQEIEEIEGILNKVRETKHLLGEDSNLKLFLIPDCGFATFADSPICESEISIQKLRVLKEAAIKFQMK